MDYTARAKERREFNVGDRVSYHGGPMCILESSSLQMGSNYLIEGGVVYNVTVWAQGGIATREIIRPCDWGYEVAYKAAASNPRTLFRGES